MGRRSDLLLRAVHEQLTEIPVADGSAVEEAGTLHGLHQDLRVHRSENAGK